MALLRLSPGDASAMSAVIERAQEIKRDYDVAMADYSANKTAQSLVPPLLKGLGSLIKKLAQAMK